MLRKGNAKDVSRVLARQRQIFGCILPTRRTGRSVEQVIVSRTERASSATSDLRHVAGRLDSFVRPKAWEAIPFVGLEDCRRSRRAEVISLWGVPDRFLRFLATGLEILERVAAYSTGESGWVSWEGA